MSYSFYVFHSINLLILYNDDEGWWRMMKDDDEGWRMVIWRLPGIACLPLCSTPNWSNKKISYILITSLNPRNLIGIFIIDWYDDDIDDDDNDDNDDNDDDSSDLEVKLNDFLNVSNNIINEYISVIIVFIISYNW